jgi:hypothetical protein
MAEELVAPVAFAALGVALLGLALVVYLLLRVRSVGRRSVGRVAPDDLSLEATVAAGLERLARVEAQLETLTERGRGAVQHVGVVRFNPFEDTGSNQSFALAMLDDDGDGIVISSLHSRQATRVYLKPISAGRAETALSEEEAEALRKARMA